MEKWYVKNTAGKVYGPIELKTLKEWVRDGRVEPLAGISCDLANWVLAPLKPELEMNWVVENNPGQFYGPTHREVLDDLKKSGALTAAARYYWDDRGAVAEKFREFENMIAMRDAQISQTELAIMENRKAIEKRDQQIDEDRKALQERDNRLDEMRAAGVQKDVKIETLHKQIQQKESEVAEANSALQKKYEEYMDLENELRRKEAEIADLKNELAKSKAIHDREWQTEAIAPEVVLAETPPPVARQAFGSLAELERRAQQELARIGAGSGRGFFGRNR